jgi:hypothetical protein|tara:strand:- start:2816 stop:3160 length:345 start_codon:yes stop_codon:yes gene_type:complete
MKSESFNKNIIGMWEGKLIDNNIYFEFNKDNSFIMRIFNVTSDSNFVIQGDFSLDYLKTPIPLSLRNISQIDHPLHTIVSFIDVDLIKMTLFSIKWRIRPVNFISNGTFILSRM